jgi:hypothetical protein
MEFDMTVHWLARVYSHCYETKGIEVKPGEMEILLGWSEHLHAGKSLPAELPRKLEEVVHQIRDGAAGGAAVASSRHRAEVDMQVLKEVLSERQMETGAWCVIDYGSGWGPCLEQVVRAKLRVTHYIRVDPYVPGATSSLSEVPSRWILGADKVAVVARYVLHHVQEEQQNELSGFVEHMISRDCAVLIAEDLLGSAGVEPECGACRELTVQWNRMALNEQKRAAKLHDWWANVVVYEETSWGPDSRHRRVVDWENFVVGCGMEIARTKTGAVDHERNHGFPSTWVVGLRA